MSKKWTLSIVGLTPSRRRYYVMEGVGPAATCKSESVARTIVGMQEIVELAHEWAAGHPLGDDKDRDQMAADMILARCEALRITRDGG